MNREQSKSWFVPESFEDIEKYFDRLDSAWESLFREHEELIYSWWAFDTTEQELQKSRTGIDYQLSKWNFIWTLRSYIGLIRDLINAYPLFFSGEILEKLIKEIEKYDDMVYIANPTREDVESIVHSPIGYREFHKLYFQTKNKAEEKSKDIMRSVLWRIWGIEL